jgi:hypothetical protein
VQGVCGYRDLDCGEHCMSGACKGAGRTPPPPPPADEALPAVDLTKFSGEPTPHLRKRRSV